MNVATVVWSVLMLEQQNYLQSRQDVNYIQLYPQVCVTHGMDWTPNKLSNMNILNVFFAKLAAVMSQNMVRSEGRISF